MQVEVKIDQEAVQASLVQAIIGSAIGEQIQKAITAALAATGDYNDRRTVVEKAVAIALQEEIRRACTEAIQARREQIKVQITDKLTDAVLTTMTDAAWDVMEGRLRSR